MAKSDAKQRINHILVAVDTSLHSLVALETAAALAARMRASLETLFVEDINLFHLAELPFARELDPTSGEERTVDKTQITQALQAHAQRVRRALTSATRNLQIQSSLRIVRGHYTDEVLRIAHADVLFMCGTKRVSVPVKRIRPKWLPVPHKPVYVLYDGSQTGKRALVLAGELTQALGADLFVLIPVVHARRPTTLRRQAELLLNDRVRTHYSTIPSSDAHHFHQVMQATGCALVVLPREQSGLISRQPGGLLDSLDCTLVLVA